MDLYNLLLPIKVPLYIGSLPTVSLQAKFLKKCLMKMVDFYPICILNTTQKYMSGSMGSHTFLYGIQDTYIFIINLFGLQILLIPNLLSHHGNKIVVYKNNPPLCIVFANLWGQHH